MNLIFLILVALIIGACDSDPRSYSKLLTSSSSGEYWWCLYEDNHDLYVLKSEGKCPAWD